MALSLSAATSLTASPSHLRARRSATSVVRATASPLPALDRRRRPQNLTGEFFVGELTHADADAEVISSQLTGLLVCRSPVYRLRHLQVDGPGGVQESRWPVRRGGAAHLRGDQDQGTAGNIFDHCN